MKKVSELIYWSLSITWGIITTAIGFIVTFILRCCNCNCYDNGFGLITEVGGNWGGLSLGPFAFCGKYKETNFEWFEHTRKHEFGHSIQNIIFGPLFIFVVAIPSAIRYWYFRLTPNKKHKEYDDIWFERTATNWGTSVIDRIESEN